MTRGSGGSLRLSGQRTFTSNLLPAYPGALTVLVFAWVCLGLLGFGLGFGLFDIDASPMKVRVEPCGESARTFPLVPPPPGDVDNPPLFKLPLEELLPDGSIFEVPLPGTETILSADNSIPAGFMENDSGARLEWNAAAAEFAPDPNAAR